MLDPHGLAERPVREECIVAGGVDVGIGGLQELVHDDPVAGLQAGLRREREVGRDPDPGDGEISA